MHYTPTDHRPDTLSDHDALVDLDSIDRPVALPAAPKTARAGLRSRLSGRPFPLDPRVNEIGPSLAAWALMLAAARLLFGLLDPRPLSAGAIETLALGAALFGATLGAVLFASGEATGRRSPYFRTHQFLMLAMALALLDWVPRIHAFATLGPALLGFGTVTAAGVILTCLRPAPRPAAGTTSPE